MSHLVSDYRHDENSQNHHDHESRQWYPFWRLLSRPAADHLLHQYLVEGKALSRAKAFGSQTG